MHDVSVDQFAELTVYANGGGTNLNFDCHRAGEPGLRVWAAGRGGAGNLLSLEVKERAGWRWAVGGRSSWGQLMDCLLLAGWRGDRLASCQALLVSSSCWALPPPQPRLMCMLVFRPAAHRAPCVLSNCLPFLRFAPLPGPSAIPLVQAHTPTSSLTLTWALAPGPSTAAAPQAAAPTAVSKAGR